jgi:hypothetical protein
VQLQLIIRRLLVSIVFVVLVWRVTSIGVANLYTEKIEAGDARAAEEALQWSDRLPEAHLQRGLSLLDSDLDEAERQVAKAYLLNPTAARPLLVLAAIAEMREDQARTEELVGLAAALRPVDPPLQQDIATYWASQAELDRALEHWTIALEADPATKRQVYPLLRQLLTDPRGREAMQKVAMRPPAWWGDFFTETALRSQDAALLRLLYDMRRRSTVVGLTAEEREVYLERMLRDEQFEEAYLAWLNSLDAEHLQVAGPLHNRSFEASLTGLGFDWHVSANDRVTIDRASPSGGRDRALRLNFRFLQGFFDDLWQPLYLDAGAYQFTGAYRTEGFYSETGLRWQVRCLEPEESLLGESARLFSAEDWDQMTFEFEVPEACVYQELRLVSAGERVVDQSTDGTLWLDDLGIRRIAELSPLARGQIEARRFQQRERADGGD